MRKVILAVCALAIFSISAFAAKSDILSLVPTATTVEKGVLEAEIGADDPIDDFDGTIYLEVEAGIHDGVEAGIDIAKGEDNDFEYFFDAKYSFSVNETQSVAAGVYNVADGYRTIPYLVYGVNVLDEDESTLDLTGGAQLVEGKLRGLFAAEYAKGPLYLEGALDFGSNMHSSVEAGYGVNIFTPYIGFAKYAGENIEYYGGTTVDINENFGFEVGASIPEKGNLTAYAALSFNGQIF